MFTEYPAAAGVLKIDLKTNKFDYMGTAFQMFIYHHLHCGTNGEILGIASQPGQSKATVSLVSLNTTNGNSTTIGTFPAIGRSFTGFVGFDGPLKITPDGKEAWVAWAGAFPPKVKTGELLIMDTSTGKIKEKHTISTKHDTPYEIYPTGADSLRVAISRMVTQPTATSAQME